MVVRHRSHGWQGLYLLPLRGHWRNVWYILSQCRLGILQVCLNNEGFWYYFLRTPTRSILTPDWFSLKLQGVCICRIHYLDSIWILALKTRMTGVIAAWPAVMCAREGSTCDLFLLVQTLIRHCLRKRSRQVLSFRAAISFYWYNKSLVVREATVVARLEYVSWDMEVVSTRSAMVSTVLYTFRWRELAEICGFVSSQVWCSSIKKVFKYSQVLSTIGFEFQQWQLLIK